MQDHRETYESDSSEKASSTQLGCCVTSLMNDGLKNQVFNRQEAIPEDTLPSLNLFESIVPNATQSHERASGTKQSDGRNQELAQAGNEVRTYFLERTENLADKPKQTLQSEAVRDAAAAVKSGNFEDLSKALQQALKNADGDRYKFADFNRELSQALKNEGVTVRFQDGKKADTTLSIHRNGSAAAVELSVYSDQNGQLQVEAQAYDWVTKKDISTKPEDTFKAAGARPGEGGVKDGKELGQAFDTARDNKDFSAAYPDLRSSFEHAYQSGGMDAVRKLESDTNKAVETRGEAPVVIEEGGKLKIYMAKRRDLSEARPEGMTAAQLKDAGIIDHPNLGFLQVLESGPTIEIAEPKAK